MENSECMVCKTANDPDNMVKVHTKSMYAESDGPQSAGMDICVPCAVQHLRGTGECSEMSQAGDACQLATCVQDVMGLPGGKTSSPSRQWVLTFVPGSAYMGVPIQSGFMKFWISSHIRPHDHAQEDREQVGGLEYEVAVYRDVVNPLIYGMVCPNFVRYLGSSSGCSLDQMLAFLVGKAQSWRYNRPYEKTLMTRETALANFARSASHMYAQRKGGPRINEINTSDAIMSQADFEKHGFSRWRYSVLINEAFTERASSFATWIQINRAKQGEVFNVIFQIMVACYALGLSQTTANDMHLNNIYIEPLKKPQTIVYIIDGIPYTVQVNNMALVYDFDQAFCTRLGPNPKLDDFYCDGYNHCNGTVMNKDAVKVLCQVALYIGADKISKIAGILTNARYPAVAGAFIAKKESFLMWGGKPLTPQQLTEMFNGLPGPDGIIAKVASLADDIQAGVKVDTPNTYVCDPSRFSPDGTLEYAGARGEI